jgi:hypothetical protein
MLKRSYALTLSCLFVYCSFASTGHADIIWSMVSASGPGSAVGIATGYGLDGPGIESRWGRDFPHVSRPALGPTQPPLQLVSGFSRE